MQAGLVGKAGWQVDLKEPSFKVLSFRVAIQDKERSVPTAGTERSMPASRHEKARASSGHEKARASSGHQKACASSVCSRDGT